MAKVYQEAVETALEDAAQLVGFDCATAQSLTDLVLTALIDALKTHEPYASGTVRTLIDARDEVAALLKGG